jgi:TonB family protein
LPCGKQLSAAWLPKEVPGLHYPRSAQLARLEGTVVVEVALDRDGRVIDAKVISGQPILAAAAKDNARLWKFETRDGVPGDQRPRLTFVFRLVGECKSQCCEDRFFFSYPNHVEITAPLPQIQGSTAVTRKR